MEYGAYRKRSENHKLQTWLPHLYLLQITGTYPSDRHNEKSGDQIYTVCFTTQWQLWDRTAHPIGLGSMSRQMDSVWRDGVWFQQGVRYSRLQHERLLVKMYLYIQYCIRSTASPWIHFIRKNISDDCGLHKLDASTPLPPLHQWFSLVFWKQSKHILWEDP